jgi:hypothetical protein
MLRNQHIIVITQQGAGRTLELTFTFVTEFTIESSVDKLTQTAEIVLPRKLYARDNNDKLYSLYSKDFNVAGFNNSNPLILKGDRVQIYAGYKYDDENTTGLWFDGFVSKVGAGKPFTIYCEDYMWKLKQKPAPNKVWKGYTVSSMLREMLQGTGVTLNATSEIGITYDVGYFTTQNMSVAQVLEKLRKDASLYSYIRGTELRVGYPLYVESEAVTHTFEFQKNIIDSDLEYKRKEDVVLSAICKTVDTVSAGTTKSGKAKTKKKRKQILVYFKNNEFKSEDITDKEAPANTEGERRTFHYFDGTPDNVMVDDAKKRLEEYYYTGFSGDITVFGTPYVKHGDNVTLVNPVLSEMNDTYKIKSVTYTGGINGLRQVLKLDFKTS